MVNTLSSGGYLRPADVPAPLEGKALLRFVQQIIVGITGLDGKMVRPYWQDEPPDVPEAGIAWAALKITRRPSDEFPFVGQYPWAPNPEAINLQRHEELDTLVTFYDCGSTGADNADGTGLADYYAALLRDGFSIPQNREQLFLTGMGLAKIGELITAPVILKGRWQYRVDLGFTIRRQIDRVYPVQTITAAHGTLYTDTGLPPQSF